MQSQKSQTAFIGSLFDRSKTLATQVHDLQEQLMSLSSEKVAAVQKEVATAEKEREELWQDAEDVQNRLSFSLNECQQHYTTAKKQLMQYRSKNQHLQSTVDRLKRKVAALKGGRHSHRLIEDGTSSESESEDSLNREAETRLQTPNQKNVTVLEESPRSAVQSSNSQLEIKDKTQETDQVYIIHVHHNSEKNKQTVVTTTPATKKQYGSARITPNPYLVHRPTSSPSFRSSHHPYRASAVSKGKNSTPSTRRCISNSHPHHLFRQNFAGLYCTPGNRPFYHPGKGASPGTSSSTRSNQTPPTQPLSACVFRDSFRERQLRSNSNRRNSLSTYLAEAGYKDDPTQTDSIVGQATETARIKKMIAAEITRTQTDRSLTPGNGIQDV